MKRNEIYTICGTNYLQMTKEILEQADLAAQLPRKDMRIGIKPNLVVAQKADTGATTHPEIVAGVIEYLQDKGYTNLCVLEGSWVGDQTSRAFRVSGIGEVCVRYQVECIDLQRSTSSKREIKGFPLQICDEALALDYLINLPVLKGHCQTLVTCALKNHKGLLPNSEKRRFHTLGLHKPIAYLAAAFPNECVIVDNICGDLDFEEGGNPVVMNRILCGLDPVLIDTFACRTMGYDTDEVRYIGMAERLGVGSTDIDKAVLIPVNEGYVGDLSSRSRRISALADYAAPKDACSACYGSLIHALDKLDRMDELWGHEEKICIGQGYRGHGGSIGVGHCTAGCDRHLEGCPPTAADILTFLQENWK